MTGSSDKRLEAYQSHVSYSLVDTSRWWWWRSRGTSSRRSGTLTSWTWTMCSGWARRSSSLPPVGPLSGPWLLFLVRSSSTFMECVHIITLTHTSHIPTNTHRHSPRAMLVRVAGEHWSSDKWMHTLLSSLSVRETWDAHRAEHSGGQQLHAAGDWREFWVL